MWQSSRRVSLLHGFNALKDFLCADLQVFTLPSTVGPSCAGLDLRGIDYAAYTTLHKTRQVANCRVLGTDSVFKDPEFATKHKSTCGVTQESVELLYYKLFARPTHSRSLSPDSRPVQSPPRDSQFLSFSSSFINTFSFLQLSRYSGVVIYSIYLSIYLIREPFERPPPTLF